MSFSASLATLGRAGGGSVPLATLGRVPPLLSESGEVLPPLEFTARLSRSLDWDARLSDVRATAHICTSLDLATTLETDVTATARITSAVELTARITRALELCATLTGPPVDADAIFALFRGGSGFAAETSRVIRRASASCSGTSSMTADGELSTGGATLEADADFIGASGMTADARRIVAAAAESSGASAMSATARRIVLAEASASGSATMTAEAAGTAGASADFAGASAMSASATVLRSAASALFGTSSMTANARRIVVASAGFAGASQATAEGETSDLATGAADFAGGSAMTAVAQRVVTASASMSGVGAATAEGRLRVEARADLEGNAAVTAEATRIVRGEASLAGQSQATATATRQVETRADFAGSGSATADGELAGAAPPVGSDPAGTGVLWWADAADYASNAIVLKGSSTAHGPMTPETDTATYPSSGNAPFGSFSTGTVFLTPASATVDRVLTTTSPAPSTGTGWAVAWAAEYSDAGGANRGMVTCESGGFSISGSGTAPITVDFGTGGTFVFTDAGAQTRLLISAPAGSVPRIWLDGTEITDTTPANVSSFPTGPASTSIGGGVNVGYGLTDGTATPQNFGQLAVWDTDLTAAQAAAMVTWLAGVSL